MIRRLTEADNYRLMDLVIDEPEFNVYVIGNVEKLGYSHNHLELYGEFNQNGILAAVLVRYYSSFYFYAKGKFDLNGFVDVLKSYGHLSMLVGKTDIVSKFEDTSLGVISSAPQHYSVLRKINSQFVIDEQIVVRKATVKDIPFIVSLRANIDEFSAVESFADRLLHDFETDMSQGYLVELDSNVVSFARTSAENSKSAMVVDVMTNPKFRQMGMASACLKALCSMLLLQQKTPCLFYKNPKAGAVYKAIGFEDIGLWSVYRFS